MQCKILLYLFAGIVKDTLNRIGKLLREEAALGRVMASRKHIYVDGVNVRRLMEDIGYLILYNVGKIELPIDDLSQTVEKSNYLKLHVQRPSAVKLFIDYLYAKFKIVQSDVFSY